MNQTPDQKNTKAHMSVIISTKIRTTTLIFLILNFGHSQESNWVINTGTSKNPKNQPWN